MVTFAPDLEITLKLRRSEQAQRTLQVLRGDFGLEGKRNEVGLLGFAATKPNFERMWTWWKRTANEDLLEVVEGRFYYEQGPAEYLVWLTLLYRLAAERIHEWSILTYRGDRLTLHARPTRPSDPTSKFPREVARRDKTVPALVSRREEDGARGKETRIEGRRKGEDEKGHFVCSDERDAVPLRVVVKARACVAHDSSFVRWFTDADWDKHQVKATEIAELAWSFLLPGPFAPNRNETHPSVRWLGSATFEMTQDGPEDHVLHATASENPRPAEAGLLDQLGVQWGGRAPDGWMLQDIVLGPCSVEEEKEEGIALLKQENEEPKEEEEEECVEELFLQPVSLRVWRQGRLVFYTNVFYEECEYCVTST